MLRMCVIRDGTPSTTAERRISSIAANMKKNVFVLVTWMMINKPGQVDREIGLLLERLMFYQAKSKWRLESTEPCPLGSNEIRVVVQLVYRPTFPKHFLRRRRGRRVARQTT